MNQKSPPQRLHTLYSCIYTDGFIHIILDVYIILVCLLTVFSDLWSY